MQVVNMIIMSVFLNSLIALRLYFLHSPVDMYYLITKYSYWNLSELLHKTTLYLNPVYVYLSAMTFLEQNIIYL